MSMNYQKIFLDDNIELTDKQSKQFYKYYELLLQWNEKINLTAITECSSVYQKHFLDSLSLRDVIPNKEVSLLDVGSGAGFPSIPLKILYPNIKVTIIDALQKRINFLRILCEELEIDVDLIHGRAEEYDKKNTFDFVTARAVANLNVLSELCIPFAKVDGYFVSMKGPKYTEEVQQCQNAFEVLGGKLESIKNYHIQDEQKTLLLIRKVKKTDDKYPRKFNQIKNRPL